MNAGLRIVYLFAVGLNVAVVGLFAWVWAVTGEDACAFWIGLHVYFGALASHALWADRQKREGLRA